MVIFLCCNGYPTFWSTWYGPRIHRQLGGFALLGGISVTSSSWLPAQAGWKWLATYFSPKQKLDLGLEDSQIDDIDQKIVPFLVSKHPCSMVPPPKSQDSRRLPLHGRGPWPQNLRWRLKDWVKQTSSTLCQLVTCLILFVKHSLLHVAPICTHLPKHWLPNKSFSFMVTVPSLALIRSRIHTNAGTILGHILQSPGTT